MCVYMCVYIYIYIYICFRRNDFFPSRLFVIVVYVLFVVFRLCCVVVYTPQNMLQTATSKHIQCGWHGVAAASLVSASLANSSCRI